MYSALADQLGVNKYSRPPPIVKPEYVWLSENDTAAPPHEIVALLLAQA